MKRALLAAVLLIAAAVPAASPAAYTVPTVSSRFAMLASGGTVVDGSSTRLLLDLHDTPHSSYTFGPGAASLLVYPQADGSQKAGGHAYFEDTSLKLRIAYTIAAPDANNVSAISGTGTLRGSGGIRGTFAITGSQDGSGLIKLRMAGKVHYPLPASGGSGRGH
jgi:hypothetical protein